MSKIILLTQEYPFGKGEGFIARELEFYSRQHQEVVIVPFKTGGPQRTLPPGVTLVVNPVTPGWFSITVSVITQGWFW